MAMSIKVDDELKDRIQKLADSKDRSPHWIMRAALNEYVAREEGKARFKAEALESWTAYQETGLHITGEEVQNWLSTWGTDKETASPACHV
jgi:predicted transcriptional regulator